MYNEQLLLKNKYINKVTILNTVDSTNNYLKSNLSIDRHLVLAYEQTAGKGQKNRSFLSENNKGIYMSYLINDISPEKLKIITIIAAIACKEILTHISLKWVNDLIYNDLKLGGILCESIHQGLCSKTIIGIGINIDKPSDVLNDIATYINIENISEFIDTLITKVNELMMKDNECLIACYEKSLCHLNEEIKVISGNKEYFAFCEGIDENGYLIVKTHNEKIEILKTETIILNNMKK